MLRSSVATAVLACAAAPPILAFAAHARTDAQGHAQGEDRGDAHVERNAPGPGELARTDGGKGKADHAQRGDDPRDYGDPRKSRLDEQQALEAGIGRNSGGKRHTDRKGPVALDRGKVGRVQVRALVPSCPPGLEDEPGGCLSPGLAKNRRNEIFGLEYRPALFGVSARGQADYAYYNGFLIPVSGTRASYVPLLGGALAVGQVWPQTYPSFNLPDWQRSFYGFDDPRAYHYADNVVYRVDPDTAAIEQVAALLTGSDFKVGSRMPGGYDVYNIPSAYRSRYADSSAALYRYADGRIYQVDPATSLIAKAIDLVS